MIFGPKNEERAYSHWYASSKISKELTDLGFPWATVHTFRHTYISHLVMANIPIAIVKEIVGHSSIQITLDSYATVIDELMISNVRALKDKLSNQDKVDKENNIRDEH